MQYATHLSKSGLNEVQGVDNLVARQRPLKPACLYELPVPEPVGGESSSEGPKHGYGTRAGRKIKKSARAERTPKPAIHAAQVHEHAQPGCALQCRPTYHTPSTRLDTPLLPLSHRMVTTWCPGPNCLAASTAPTQFIAEEQPTNNPGQRDTQKANKKHTPQAGA